MELYHCKVEKKWLKNGYKSDRNNVRFLPVTIPHKQRFAAFIAELKVTCAKIITIAITQYSSVV